MTRWILRACLMGCWAATAYGQQPEKPEEKIPVLPKEKDAGVGPPPCAPMIDKTLCLPSVVLVPEETAVAVPKMDLREVEVGRDRLCVELDWREEKRTITVLVLKPTEEVQQVCTTKLVEETCLDCHGKPQKTYKQVPEIVPVKVMKYCAVPETREVVVRIPILKPGPEVRIKKLVLDCYSVPGIERRFHAEYKDNEIQIAVPACPFPPPPPPCVTAETCPVPEVPHAPSCAK